MIRPGAAFINDVSIRSWRPATISGLSSIASRTVVSEAARAERGSSAGTAPGSASIANARATSRRRNAYVSTPQPSIAVWSLSGAVPYAAATAAR